MIAAKKLEEYISLLEQEFVLGNITVNPKYYLGWDFNRRDYVKTMGKKKDLKVSAETCIGRAARRLETDYGCIKKEPTPIGSDDHPAIDTSRFLPEDRHSHS